MRILFILSMACTTTAFVAWFVSTRIKVGIFHVPPPYPPSFEETRRWRAEKEAFEKRFKKAKRLRLILVRVDDYLFKTGVLLLLAGVVSLYFL